VNVVGSKVVAKRFTTTSAGGGYPMVVEYVGKGGELPVFR